MNDSVIQIKNLVKEYKGSDGTIVQAHQKASGAKGGLNIKPSGALVAG